MITETSRGGPLEERRAWLRQSLAAVASLRADGIPLVGYTWFPFTALIDWAYREATTPVDDWIVQMGMVDLHRDSRRRRHSNAIRQRSSTTTPRQHGRECSRCGRPKAPACDRRRDGRAPIAVGRGMVVPLAAWSAVRHRG